LSLALAFAAFGPACSDSPDGNGSGNGGFSLGGDLVLDINPTQVVFGSVAVNDTATQDVTLTHVGKSGTISLRNVRLESNSDELSVTLPDKDTLEPGESTTLTVTYKPVDDTEDSGTVRFDTNIPLSGGGTFEGAIPVLTLKPYGELNSSPGVVDFGAVEGGTTANKTATIKNIGSLPVQVTEVAIKLGGSVDFALVSGPDLPLELAPNDAFPVELSYTPTDGDVDTAQLRVRYKAGDQDVELDVLLKGSEVSPRLVAFPNPVDFGQRPVDTPAVKDLSLANQGSLPLVISAVTVEPTGDWSDTVSVTGFPAEGATLADATPLSLTVTFTPTADMAVVTTPIANIKIVSNDPAGDGVTIIPVFGRPEAPSLQVNPPDLVDFGFVAQNLTTTRELTLSNKGSADLIVEVVTVTDEQDALPGEFTIANADAWGPTAASPTAAVIAPDTFQTIKVEFTNLGGDTGVAWGKLVVTSNDGQQPTWEVNLKAQRAGAPTCKIELQPASLDYGIVPRGFSKTMSFQLVNVGSGVCSFHSAFVNDCSGWMGLGTATCPDPNNSISTEGNSDVYAVTEKPPAIQDFLKPGQAYPISVTFTPPDSAPLFGDETTDYAGLLGVRVTHNYVPGQVTTLVYPEGSNGNFTANLHAKSGLAELSVFPNELDFGLVTVGCYSQTMTINAYNVGTAPLDLTDWELVGCSPEFVVKSYPALDEPDGNGGFKKTLAKDEGVTFDVVYHPQTDEDDECALALYTNGSDTPAAVVPLRGGGTFETEQTDEYIQKSGQDVDILFVVDNSGSMGEEQNNLSKNFSDFIAEAGTWQNDYHVGVVTTDVDGDAGILQGTPQFVTPATGWTAFSNNVKVGTNGSGTEKGLMAAQLALSLPLTADSATACTSDADCTEPEKCVTEPGTSNSFCGGPNRAFLRDDATLEIVFVSDEDDQSPSDLNFYINFFKNLKGFYNSNLLHAHAIVGPNGGCSSSNGDAVSGSRYIDVANQTGGNVISICEPDFATGLKSIGELAFGLKVQFFLTRIPDPASITVKVDNVPCDASGGGQSNWVYDEPSNAIIFNEAGGCMPQPGQDVWIHYETVCFLE